MVSGGSRRTAISRHGGAGASLAAALARSHRRRAGRPRRRTRRAIAKSLESRVQAAPGSF
jgi:hypothetical protein